MLGSQLIQRDELFKLIKLIIHFVLCHIHLSAGVPKSVVEGKGLKGIIYKTSFTDMDIIVWIFIFIILIVS
jgi:hypothetical protein